MAHEDKLLQKALTGPLGPGFVWVLADSPLLDRILLRRQKGWQRQPFAIEALRGALGNSPLFGAPPPSLWDLPPKFTDKDWARVCDTCQGFPTPSTAVVFLGPTSVRKNVSALAPPGDVWVWYPPLDRALIACAQVLAAAWFPSGQGTPQLCQKALDVYQGDLLEVDMHFERMALFGCPFDEAVVASAPTAAFGVVDALAQGKKRVLVQNFEGFLGEGGEAGAVLGAVLSFLRQWVQLKAHGGDFREACRSLAIPYPAQGRFQVALKTLDPGRVVHFLGVAAYLERGLRLGGGAGVQTLLVELTQLIEPNV